MLCELFTKHSNEENLQKFISDNAVKIHKLNFEKDKIISIKKEKWQIPSKYGDVVPFKANEFLEFKTSF